MTEPPDHRDGRDPLVELDPPLTETGWAPDLVTQSLEALFVFLAEDGAHVLRPIHADSLRIGWPTDRQPGDLVVEAAERYGLTPLLAHSTSWRHESGRLILTYVVAVERPSSVSQYLADELVTRAELARGDALSPPPAIDVAQVIEHAFRHLAWLVRDDPAVGDALGSWAPFLEAYVPEPFRAFAPSSD
jgi:hypothetical protein